MDKGACQATVHGVTKSGTQLNGFHTHTQMLLIHYNEQLYKKHSIIFQKNVLWHKG